MQQSWHRFGPTVPVPLDPIRQAAHADDLTKTNINPGCSAIGRLKGLADIRGAVAAFTLMRNQN